MDFSLGILGILQITILPGLIIQKFVRFRRNLFESGLIVFGLSLIANYCLAFFLAALGLYVRGVLLALVFVEFVVLFWLYRDGLMTSLDTFLTSVWGALRGIFDSLTPRNMHRDGAFIASLIWLALVLFFAIKGMIWVGNVFFANLGTVFSTWDAVVSWNRWATIWAAGRIPVDSHFYPQLIPANWSITYLLLGDSTLQFFAKSIMPLFALSLFIGFFNLALDTRESYFLVGAALMAPILKQFLESGVSNGYVDIAVAFWGFMTIYLLIRAQNTIEFDQRYHLLLMGAVFASGAAVTKQTGVYLALCYPILAGLMMMQSPHSALWKEKWKGFVTRFATIYLIWLSWYLFKGTQMFMGADRANLDVLINLSSNTYENVGLAQQLTAAIGRFDRFILLFLMIGLAFPLMNRFYRLLTLLILPYPFLWAWMAGYDTRNLAIFLPIFALLSGYSVNILVYKVLEAIYKTKLIQIPAYIPLMLVCIGLIGVGFIISPKLHERQVALQKQNFSPKTNEMLYNLIKAENSQTKILTNYPMQYVPGLEPYQVRFDFQDQAVFLDYLENPQIEYILLPNAVTSGIRKFIDAKIEDGSYKLLATNTQWKKFRLIKIVKKQ
jgi:hypothetical protein